MTVTYPVNGGCNCNCDAMCVTTLESVFTWKLILDPPFGSTICLYFWCMVSGIFFCGEAGEGGLSEYGGSDDIAGIMIS